METETMNIGELADRAGLTRRAIRFYVQQGLIPAPRGLGRGDHYDQSHLQRLLQIQELQSAGHSLLAIRQILQGNAVPPPTVTRTAPRQPALSAQLWIRLKIMEGVELHLDLERQQATTEQLQAAKAALRQIFGS